MKKRRLLNDQGLSPQSCRDYGERYLALEWWDDALDFFLKANDPAGLEKVKAHCLDAGDAFLLGRTGKQDPQTWLQVGEKALALGKLQFARKAFERAGDAARAAMVEGLIAERAGEQRIS